VAVEIMKGGKNKKEKMRRKKGIRKFKKKQ
jgi:hypothetical protein